MEKTETEILPNQAPEYDAVVILGGNIRKTGQKSGLEGYVSTSYKEKGRKKALAPDGGRVQRPSCIKRAELNIL
jgi:hypothetical protein